MARTIVTVVPRPGEERTRSLSVKLSMMVKMCIRDSAYVEDRFVNPDAAEEATRAAAAESEFGESIDSEVEDSVPDTSAEAVPETPAEPEDEGFVEESFIDDDEEQEKKA